MRKDGLDGKTLPDAPGVYFFNDSKHRTLYIGKATSLRSRVKSYFVNNIAEVRSPLIAKMVSEAVNVTWVETESVLEALILETNLIRLQKPVYNTKSKDDKSYSHVIITKELWPRVLVVRGRDILQDYTAKDIAYHFGPFPSANDLRIALKIIRKIFRYFDTTRPIEKESSRLARGKIAFNQQIGIYPTTTDHDVYLQTIRHIRLFFQGKKQVIVKEITRLMQKAAAREEFELAALYKKQLFALQHIEDVALIRTNIDNTARRFSQRIEAYDIAHLQGRSMVGVMVAFSDGVPDKEAYRKFIVRSVHDAHDPAALREVLLRRLQHTEWDLPQLIVVDGNEIQKRVAETLMREHGLAIPVVAVTKDDRHKPKHVLGDTTLIEKHMVEILQSNAEAHRFAISFHRERERKQLVGDNTSN